MLDIDFNDTIVVCNNYYKKYLLTYFSDKKLFLNVKFYTKESFIEEFCFKYSDNTISYLLEKYEYKIDIIKNYLKNLYYIEDREYKSVKLQFLHNLKQELINNDLIVFGNTDLLKDKKIIVIGYPYLLSYERNLFSKLNAEIIEEKSEFEIKNVYECKNMNDEINLVANKICELIENNIPVNQIKIVGINDDYSNEIERIFKEYNIPIKINNEVSLYSLESVQKFIENINNLEDALKYLSPDISKIIVRICNKYVKVTNNEVKKELIIYDLRNTYIDRTTMKNYIEVVDIFYPFKDEYVFVMNFNTNSFPVVFKDEEYITDNIGKEVGKDAVNIKNKAYKNSLINKLKSIKNLTISYKLSGKNGEEYKSPLVDELNLEIVENNNESKINYAENLAKLNLAIFEDYRRKYGVINKDYYLYKNSFNDIAYLTYDNRFKGIDKDDFNNYLKDKLVLSYSSLNNYNKCAFRYYLVNVLKIDKYEETFEAFIGSLFHYVLEKCLQNNSKVTDEIDAYLKSTNKECDNKEKLFIEIISEDIEFVLEEIKRQNEIIGFKNVLYEREIIIEKANYIFKGFIDKILYQEEFGSTNLVIIDYKTGNIDINLKYLPYGLSLQLPIYLYLVKNSKLFNNPKFVGFYLQHILDKNIGRDYNDTYDNVRRNRLKLTGFSNKDIHYLSLFDKTYENSEIVKSLKIKNDGNFSANSKVLDDEEIEKIIELTEKNIVENADKILNANFSINPKKIGFTKDLGCEFCRFKDICYKQDKDYVILEDIKDLDFLRGDE